MPTTPVDTFSARKIEPAIAPHLAVMDAVPLAPNLTITRGTVLGFVTASGRARAYASGNADGSQTARVVAMYDCTTDANGNVTLAHEHAAGTLRQTLPVWIGGYFRAEDLTGLDAGAVTAFGRMVTGTVTNGLLKIN
jgi:Bacteriophage lambda head decoration protein D